MKKSNIKRGYKSAISGAKNGIQGTKQVHKTITGKSGPVTAMKGLKLIGQAIKETSSGIKDIASGIFNDPNWWKGDIKPYLAINPSRPMTPSDLADYSLMGTRLGVGHLSSLEVNFQDIFSSPVLLAATSQMYQTIRNNLRSNLNYDLSDIQNYLKLVTSIMIEVKMIERTLGWHNYARSDIPEFHDAWIVYPIPTDVGRVNYSNRSNTGEGYADAISRVDILKSSVRQLPIPKKLGEFLAWLYGSVFTDPDEYNPQVYYVDATAINVYLNPDDTSVLTTIDPRSQTVQNVIDQCAAVLSKYGALAADLGRIAESFPNSIGLIDFVRPSEYKSIMLYDKEFVNFVINGYTLDVTNGMTKPDFLRIDILQDVLDDEGHIAATTNGMGAVLASSQFKAIAVQAQNFYFSAGVTNMPRNISQTSINQVFSSINAYTPANGLWICRVTSYSVNKFAMSLTSAADTRSVNLSSKVTWNAPTSGTLIVSSASTENFKKPGPFAGRASHWAIKAKLLEGNISNGYLDAYIEDSDVTINYDKTFQFTAPKLVFYLRGTKLQEYTIQTKLLTLKVVDAGWSAWQDWTFAVTFNLSQKVENANIISMFALSSTVLPVNMPASGIQFLYSVTDATYAIEYTPMALTCAWLTQMFDYHIPFVIVENISGGSSAPLSIQLWSEQTLLKECYISAIYNKYELEAVVQQLYYNLIAIE